MLHEVLNFSHGSGNPDDAVGNASLWLDRPRRKNLLPPHNLAEASHEAEFVMECLGDFRATGKVLQIFDLIKGNHGIGQDLAVVGDVSHANVEGFGNCHNPVLQLFGILKFFLLSHQGTNEIEFPDQVLFCLVIDAVVQPCVGIP